MKLASRVVLLLALAVASAVGAMPTTVSADEFEDQPANKHSNITTHPTPAAKDAESIVDVSFAKALHDALGDNGFHSMVITFGQCYGGGMIDDVADEFAGSTKPISMTSASKHDEESESGPHGPTDKDTGFNFWAEGYRNSHPGKTGNTNNNPKESDAYTSTKNDPANKSTKTSQHKTLNGGGDIKLGNGTNGSGATSYHAILFAGNTADRDDYWNDIARQHKMLTNSGYPAGNIKTYYGNGNVPAGAAEPAAGIDPDPATRANLIAAIQALQGVMNENEQLYIFITDHGSPDQGTDTVPKPKVVPPKGTKDSSNSFSFSPLSTYLVDALGSPLNTSGPYIDLDVDTAGTLTSNWEVYFNDSPLAVNAGDNSFPGGGGTASLRFPIDPGEIDLTGSNEVWLRNTQITDDTVAVEMYLSMGDLNTAQIPAVGGTVELLGDAGEPPAEGGGSGGGDGAAAPVAAAGVGGALVALAAGGWIVRRRLRTP
jgi:hypothetical protein